MARTVNQLTKVEIAKRLGIARSSLYYKPKRERLDLEVKNQIESVLTQNPYYGHKRIALALKLNKKRILRLMKKYNLSPLMRRARYVKKSDIGRKPTRFENSIEKLNDELVFLIERIYYQVWYYNNERIHTSLGMSPVEFRLSKDLVS